MEDKNSSNCVLESLADVDTEEKAINTAKRALNKLAEFYPVEKTPESSRIAKELKIETLKILTGLDDKGYDMNRYSCEMFEIIRRYDFNQGITKRSFEEKTKKYSSQ